MFFGLAVSLVGLLLGGMIYVTVLVAPIIFIVLDDPEATQFTRKLWPRYFLINATLSAITGILLLYLGWMYSAWILFLVSGFMVVDWILAGRMQTIKEPNEDYVPGSTYDWFHSVTVWSNGLSIVLALSTMIFLSYTS